jgi:hypothetical protein
MTLYGTVGCHGWVCGPMHGRYRLPWRRYTCLQGTQYSVVLSLTQHCAGTACAMKLVRPTTNEGGCLWTQNTVTSHQFYAVPRKNGETYFPTILRTLI